MRISDGSSDVVPSDLLNLRGNDVSYNPVFLEHALIGRDSARLFVAPGKIPAELCGALARDGISVEPYEEAAGALACLPEGQGLLVDPARTTVGTLASAAFADKIEAINPSQLLKSRKNAEIGRASCRERVCQYV